MPTVKQNADSIAKEFSSLPNEARLEYLLEFSESLPKLPEKYSNHPDLLEKVEECQSPVFLFVEVDIKNIVHVFLIAPEEAPTTRAFASILTAILNQQPAIDVLALSNSYPLDLGLTALVSPLRIRGMTGMLNRIKRQVSEKLHD